MKRKASKKNAPMAEMPGGGSSYPHAVLAGLLLFGAMTDISGAAAAGAPVPVNQLPTGAKVAAGSVVFKQTQTAAAAAMLVQQTSAKAIVNWDTFNLGSKAAISFNQPSSSSVILNRVLDTNASQIFGQISGNGQVFFTNPNGIYFGPGSSVSVGALVATTGSILDKDFLAGNYFFTRSGSTRSILNEGALSVLSGGYAALMGSTVSNKGLVSAQITGSVFLASGESYQLQFDAGSGLLNNILVKPSTLAALVENSQLIQAPGGMVVMTAQAASTLLGGVVRNTGVIDASGLVEKGGVIRLTASDAIVQTGKLLADAAPNSSAAGGNITVISDLGNPHSVTEVGGLISAKGGEAGGDGGFIETSASKLVLRPDLQVLSTGRLPGTWLLDPLDVDIDGAAAGQIVSALNASTNVSIQTTSTAPFFSCTVTCASTSAGAGNITLSAPISASGAGSLTLRSVGSIYINANVSTGGAQNYLGPVVLSNNPVLASSNALIYFGGTVDAASLAGSALTLQQGNGNAFFSAAVGASYALSSLSTGAGPVSLGGSVTTSGAQTFGGNLVLEASSISLVSSTGGISIAGSLLTQPIYRFFSGGSYTLNGGASISAGSQTDALGVSYAGGSFSWTPVFSKNSVDVLLVGGGGGGGAGSGGGGGAGGLISTTSNISSATSYTLQVGAAGAGGTTGQSGQSGTSTTGFGSVALGGGGGGKTATPGLAGASSGGSGSGSGNNFGGLTSSSADTSSGIQGTNGGLGYPSGGGSGGGSGTGGGSASSTGGPTDPGGSGSTWSVTGSSVFYAAGGGGGGNAVASGALGGSTIGGRGGSAAVAATSASSYGAGGGGGSSGTGSAAATGGSGSAGLIAVAPQYSSSVTINTGAGTFTSGAISNPSSLTLVTNSPVNSVISGVIAGSMALNKQGSGNLNLTAANTYTGGTNLSAGTITLTGSGTLGASSGAVALSGSAVLDVQTALTLGSLSMESGNVITRSSGSSSLSVSGTSVLAGTITTSGTQTYSGAATLASNVSLTSTNSAITLGSTLNSTAGNNFSLTTSTGSGPTVLSGEVGGIRALSTVSISGNASLGANVSTLGHQVYGGNVVLTSAGTTMNTSTGDVSIAGNLSSTYTAPADFNDVYQFLGNGYYSFDSPTNATRILATATPDGYGVSWNGSTYTFLRPSGVSSASILVVGGGGAGGSAFAGGGGGAGGLIYQSNFALSSASYSITVGAGGARSASALGAQGNNGSNSIFGNLTAYGGGGGGSCNCGPFAGKSGASGGGAGYGSPTAGSALYASAGNLGSNGLPYQSTIGGGTTGLYNHGGGGGGALASNNGNTATTYDLSVNRPTRSVGYSIDGGDGLAFTISGVKTYYAGGGAAGSDGYGGLGGLGGGGNGGHGLTGSIFFNNGTQVNGIDALANTGGGGGGGGGNAARYSGAGGSGIVIASVAATKYGALTVNASAGKLLIQGNVSNVSGLNVNVNSTTSSQVVGTVSGNLALSKSGTGTLLMSGANTYAQGTTVLGGVLQAGRDSAGYAFTQSITLTSGSTKGTFATNNSAVIVGQVVSGPGIPAGTTVVSVSDLTFEMSAASTASATSSLTFTSHNFMSASPFGVRAVTVSGGQVDLNGKIIGNNFSISSQNTAGALTNALAASTATAAGMIDLTASSTIGGAGSLVLTNGFNANSFGAALVGTGVITATNSQNSFATIASGSSLGGLTLFNGGSMAVGAVTVSGVTSRGVSSSGLLRIYTYDGDIAISESITTSSTANSSSAPALIISAGTLYPKGYNYGGHVMIDSSLGSPTISVGTGGIADIYSGNPNLSTGLSALVNSKTPSAVSVGYNTQYSTNYASAPTLYLAPSTAGYNLIYRSNAAITPLYAYLYPNQSIVYGTTPVYTFATSAGTTAGVLYYGLFTQSSGGTTGSSLGSPGFGTISFRNQVSSTTGAGSYQLTYKGGITLASTSYVLGASNPAVTVTVNKAPLGIAVSGTYSGSTIVGPVSVTAYGLKNSETLTGFDSVTLNSKNFADNSTNFVVSETGAIGTASLSNYSISNGVRIAGSGTTANTVTLNKANLNLSAVASLTGNVYNGSAYTGSYTLNALGSDVFTVSGVSTGTDAGTYPSNLQLSSSVAVLANYNSPVITNANLVISPKPVTLTNTARSSTYDGVSSYASLAGATQFTASAMVGSDAVASVTQTASGTGVTLSGVAQAGSFTVTPSAAVLSSGLSGNYSFSYAASNYMLGKANAVVTANSGMLTYNGANQTVSGFSATGLVGGETVSVLTGVSASRTEKNAGTYTVTASGTASNYNLSFVDGSLLINKANAVVTANSGT
ncbi:MAG: glycine-rich domain-containing protein, partial [Betaproteobacteria bacterium]